MKPFIIRTRFYLTVLLILSPWGLFATPRYNLNVVIEPETGLVSGKAQITMDDRNSLTMYTGNLELDSISPEPTSRNPEDGTLTFNLKPDEVIQIDYHAVMTNQENMIEKDQLALLGLWYPYPETLVRYELSVDLPSSFIAISEANQIETTPVGERTTHRFHFDPPMDNLHLIASTRWHPVRVMHNGVEIVGLFYENQEDLAKSYIEKTEEFIDLYVAMLGDFPYKRFAVVEHFQQIGVSMPTFTLMGDRIVHIPAVRETSLGHEILHQWMGNYVYIDAGKGNWGEGLTTYMADHYYRERTGTDSEYRRNWLNKYESFLNQFEDQPLSDFRSMSHGPGQAVGYGKAAFVFHMLRRKLGKENFLTAIRHFLQTNQHRLATWDDIRKSFEYVSGEDLSVFFYQWINYTGLPRLDIIHPQVRKNDSGYLVSIPVFQVSPMEDRPPYSLEVPVLLESENQHKWLKLKLSQQSKTFDIQTDFLPQKLILDPQYDIPRRLHAVENPPSIGRLFSETDLLVIYNPDVDLKLYESLKSYLFNHKNVKLVTTDEVQYEDLRNMSVLFLGRENKALLPLYGFPMTSEKGTGIFIRSNPWNNHRIVALIHTESDSSLKSGITRGRHYGNYSDLQFADHQLVTKSLESPPGGVEYRLPFEPALTDQTQDALDNIVRYVLPDRVVFVGEAHNKYSHHRLQKEIIRKMHENAVETGKYKIVIGMEMFQTKYQDILDRYLAGKIGEKEFLKESHWFNEWGFDYHLYKDIIDYAKENRIPIRALNIDRSIVRNVYMTGIYGLDDAKRKQLPPHMTFWNKYYNNFLKNIFHMHGIKLSAQAFEYFTQSQILWDESMAYNISKFLQKNQDYKMVVVVGSGHVRNYYGIPDRLKNNYNINGRVVLMDENPNPGLADFILETKEMNHDSMVRLGIVTGPDKDGPVIRNVEKDSPAQVAGLLPNDVLISINGVPVSDTEDLKIELFYVKDGDKIEVTIRRDGNQQSVFVQF